MAINRNSFYIIASKGLNQFGGSPCTSFSPGWFLLLGAFYII